MLEVRILDPIATVIGRWGGRGEPGRGHPPAETVRVLGPLRRFLREGTPWRSLRATPGQASGSTLRRRLAGWAAVNLLQRVHALPVAMLRGHPDLILDSRPHGSGLGERRWPVERSNAWLLENKRLALRYDRLGFVVQSLLQAACLFLVAGRLDREF